MTHNKGIRREDLKNSDGVVLMNTQHCIWTGRNWMYCTGPAVRIWRGGSSLLVMVLIPIFPICL